MKIVSLDECRDAYKSWGGWDGTNDSERNQILKKFPHSVIVETSYLEYDEAILWLKKNFSELSQRTWQELWYTKTDYDYGFWEFFFNNYNDSLLFMNEVPKFYATVNGKAWRTEGPNNFIEIKNS